MAAENREEGHPLIAGDEPADNSTKSTADADAATAADSEPNAIADAEPETEPEPEPVHPLIEHLLAKGKQYSFFQAVRLIQSIDPDAAKIGHQGPLENEPLRFRSTVSLNFDSSDLSAIREAENPEGKKRLDVHTTFLSLIGANSPIPAYYTEMLVDNDEARRLIDFLDMFHHRMMSLFYRAWEKYRTAAQYTADGRDYFSQRLMMMLGIEPDVLPDGARVTSPELLAYAGLMTQQPRSAAALEGILNDYFPDTPIEIEPCIGRWLNVPDDQKNALGKGNCTLGDDFTLGERVYDRSCTFRITIGPLDAKTYAEFLPTGERTHRLREIVDLFNTDCFDYELVLLIDPADVPELNLSSQQARLGWSTWVGQRPETQTHVQFRTSGWLHG